MLRTVNNNNNNNNNTGNNIVPVTDFSLVGIVTEVSEFKSQ
jgi:hypothetical protein